MLNVRSSGPSCRFSRAEQRADLVRLAAQADDQHAGEVRVPRVAAERAAQELHALAVRVHAAAGAVRQRDDAVDVGKRGEALAREMVGDAARDRRRAIDRRQDADVVARRDAAVGVAHDAHERRRRRRRTASASRRRRTRSRDRTRPSRGCGGARARPARCRGSRSR